MYGEGVVPFSVIYALLRLVRLVIVTRDKEAHIEALALNADIKQWQCVCQFVARE